MVPYSYQTELSEQALAVLKEHFIVYLAMEERTGKTLTAILTAEACNISKVLVITKKKALDGWNDTLKAFKHEKVYTVTNYHQASKVASEYDLVILDEAHNYLSGFPKPSAIWKTVKKLTKAKPIIYLSATPYAQGAQLLYHQFALSSWSPWLKYPSYYSWFKTFGVPRMMYLYGRQVLKYDTVKTDEVLACVQHLFITKTRRELEFDHEPEDLLHYITLAKETKQLYNELIDNEMVKIQGLDLIADTGMKLRTSLHMLEGGVAKIENNYLVLDNTEKIEYIKEHWGDTNDLIIMYQYKAEKLKLESAFRKARVLQATSFAEGVDLSKHKNLVIYSQDFSTARHTQRRARQANKKRTTPIIVHYLLAKDAISEQVYKTVSVNKQNFVDSVFTREML